nr:immunoglobulin heavy chain junction region [Mus musculus]NSM05276.1 immunoglobulin heavy chain junction region [Mus musculus]NSM05319.1 immunoglobulin heavy chain junction region [Mus musculus]NSM05416.1 immunoglobulin heavy chain junction region [Mus musculus]NSM06155.1 immunoglobulin heavy chain junction region [Mus musculus]
CARGYSNYWYFDVW